MVIYTDKEVEIVNRFHLDKEIIPLLRRVYCILLCLTFLGSEAEIRHLEKRYIDIGYGDPIKYTRWKFLFKESPYFIKKIIRGMIQSIIYLIDKETDFNLFFLICVYLSTIENDLLYTSISISVIISYLACLMINEDVNPAKITQENLKEVLKICGISSQIMQNNLLMTLFQIYDKHHRGFITFYDYMSFAHQNNQLFNPILLFKKHLISIMFTDYQWSCIEEKLKHIQNTIEYNTLHKHKPRQSICRWIRNKLNDGFSIYEYDFEPLSNDLDTEIKLAANLFLNKYNPYSIITLNALDKNHGVRTSSAFVCTISRPSSFSMNTDSRKSINPLSRTANNSVRVLNTGRYKNSIVVPIENESPV